MRACRQKSSPNVGLVVASTRGLPVHDGVCNRRCHCFTQSIGNRFEFLTYDDARGRLKLFAMRAWRGKTHTILVLDDGFEHHGKRYTSLTQIANALTGTQWSGPRFFGLVTPQQPTRGRKSGDGSE